MKQRSTLARRAMGAAGIGGALLLTSLGLNVTPAGATTTAVTTTTGPFTAVDYTGGCNGTVPGEVPSSDQTLREGPATPPSGTGSLSMAITDVADLELYRSAKYDGTELSALESVQYSTYLETDGGQPPAIRLVLDTSGDGVYDRAVDHRLYFVPANNTDTQGRTVTSGVWQTWDATAGVWNEDGDGGPGAAMTLSEYLALRPGATIVAEGTLTDGQDPNLFGGTTFMNGCASGPAAQVSDIDEIVVDLADQPVDKYDLEATAPARKLTLSTTAGMPGSSFTVSGTDCFESTVTAMMGESRGQSGDELAWATATPAADGTWTATITIPKTADPQADHNVFAVCGPEADPAFSYASQTFEVAGRMTGANGYREVAADGGIFTFGARNFHGSTGDMKLNKPIVGGATDISDYDGYWIVASDGGIFTFNAEFYGSLGDKNITSPAVEIEPTPTGKGYFIVLADGTVHAFGDATKVGDMSGKALNKPIIGMSVTPTGKGYWLVAQDGGIFNFGDADFFGSTGDKKLNAPIIDLAPAVDNKGYYLLGADGGVFTFGSADFKGSTGDMKLNAPVVAMLVNPAGSGYWLAASDGGIFTFGAGADFLGSMGGTKLNSPVLDLIN